MTDAYNRAVARIEKFLNGVSLAMDAGEHGVTVNAGSASGGEGGGSHVMLDGEGRVKAGMGGKFTGTRIDDIPRKKFMNEQAYQRKQERDALEAKAKAAKPARATKSKAKETKAPFTPSQPMHPALKRNEDGSMSVKFAGYPGREVLDELKGEGLRYDGDTRTWSIRTSQSDAPAKINEILARHIKPAAPPVKIPQATMSRITSAGLTESRTSPGRFYMPRTSVYNPEAADRAYNDLFGLKITRYGTGNISSAELDGEKISNTHAKHLIGMSSAANFDTSTGKWNKLDPELQAIWDKRQGAQS